MLAAHDYCSALDDDCTKPDVGRSVSNAPADAILHTPLSVERRTELHYAAPAAGTPTAPH